MMARMVSRVRRVASTSPHELWTRAVQHGLALGERGHLLLGTTPLSSVRRPSLGIGSAAVRPFWPGLDQVEATSKIFSGLAGARNGVLARATRIETGDVELMGIGWVHVGERPNWHREPISGIVAPSSHWSTIPYLDPAQVGDHKLLWEFNRHQQWVTLAQAWALTRDQRWRATWEAQLSSWLDQNPATVGMNWSSSLEVAYRAISWCWASRLFGTMSSDVLEERMLRSLEAHGRHVHRYLSTYFSPNTHLTGEALGLFYIGATFPGLRGAQKWREAGAAILEQEVARQILPDGVYFEQATQYHRYTAEIYLHFVALSDESGWPVSAETRRALGMLFDVLVALRRTDGSMALLGDDDGGRLVQLDGAKPHDLRGLLSAGAIALDRPDLAHAGAGDVEMATWLFGASAASRLDALRARKPGWTPPAASAFRSAGLFVVRDAPAASESGRATGHATIDAGPHGALSFGHSHADALSVELFAGGGPLFIDSGTATYVGAQRNAFRGTAAHNTVELNGTGICEPGTAFRWKSVTDGIADAWVHSDGMTWFSGHHEGYAGLASPAVHERSMLHPVSGVWVVRDTIRSEGQHGVALRWHCDPSITPVERHGTPASANGLATVDLLRGERCVATVVIGAAPGIEGALTVRPGQVSPQFGQIVDAKVLHYGAKIRGDAQVCSIVLDWMALGDAAAVLVESGGAAAVLRSPDSRGGAEGAATHRIRVNAAHEVECDAFRATAGLSCIEFSGDEATRVVAVDENRWFVAVRQRPQWGLASGFLSTKAT